MGTKCRLAQNVTKIRVGEQELSRKDDFYPRVLLSSFSPPHVHLKASQGVFSWPHFPNTALIGPCIAANPYGQPISHQKNFHMPQLPSFNLLTIQAYFALALKTSYPSRPESFPLWRHTLLSLIFASEAPSCTTQLRAQLPSPPLPPSEWIIVLLPVLGSSVRLLSSKEQYCYISQMCDLEQCS